MDYLDLTAGDAQAQFRMLLERRPVRQGRQVTFLPVETLLCLAASFLVKPPTFPRRNRASGARAGALAGPVVLPAAVQRAGQDGQLGRFAVSQRPVGRPGWRHAAG
jgi:hypothetical protein